MDTAPEKELTNPSLELYDIELTPLPDNSSPRPNSPTWIRENPGIKTASWKDETGKKHYFTYGPKDVPRYRPVSEPASQLPEHITLLVDTNIGRKVIAKAGLKSIGSGWWKWSDPIEEARKTGVSEHPHIVSVYNMAVNKEGEPYIIMEYLSNGTLHAWLKGSHTPEQIAAVIEGLSSALNHIHTKRKLVYADMKPLNIGFDKDWQPKICDFELAERMENGTGVARGPKGTFAYAAPEQLKGELLSVATDIYSLAAVAFSIFIEKQDSDLNVKTVRDLFEKNPASLVPFRKDYEDKLNSRQKQEITRVLHWALDPDAQKRYSSIQEFNKDFQQGLRP